MKSFLLSFCSLFIIGTAATGQSTNNENSVTSESYNQLIPTKPEKIRETGSPMNIILMIGDGMGLTQISSAFYFKNSIPHYARFNDVGLIRTSSTAKITDSAAGATAFASGQKTYNGAIGVDPDTISIPTIVEILSRQQWKTGLISTSSITHATPACFYSHVKSRGMQEAIAAQLTTSEVDFIAGGGFGFFADTSRSDGQDYLMELEKNGFQLNTKKLKKRIDADKKHAFLLGHNAMPTILQGRGDFLPEATALAIDYLDKGSEHFFLMVEGSMIDWGGHGNDTDFLVSEMIDFDDAIGVALDFAQKDGNTLVIVTADHETGGFTLSSGDNYNQIKGTFSTGGHSTTLLPAVAFGPGSELFRGIYENTEIFHNMLKAINTKKTN
ncbi:MAG: alkaline phosphatase [Cyclobacteriaceae bacterium]|nr:MAG: alkaline phosphatase [Cyclobacteriaceae bacterium]